MGTAALLFSTASCLAAMPVRAGPTGHWLTLPDPVAVPVAVPPCAGAHIVREWKARGVYSRRLVYTYI
jgi:hypothetical protein